MQVKGIEKVGRRLERHHARLDQPPEPAVVLRQGWGPWVRHLTRRARVMTLEATANFLDSFYLHGPVAAALVFGFEYVEHTLIPFGPPLCKVVQGTCMYIARETQELRRALFTSFPGVRSARERVALLKMARRLRRERKQALRDVMHAADGRDVVVHERPRAPGAQVLHDSCFRSALGTPDPTGHLCTEDHAAGLRYPRAGRGGDEAPAVKSAFTEASEPVNADADDEPAFLSLFGDLKPAAPPAAAGLRADSLDPVDPDLVGDEVSEDATARGWAAADVIGFTNLKLDLARAALGELAERDLRAFFGLRRRLTGMRKALLLYGYTLSLRGSLGRPRNADEAEMDRRFDQSLTQFLTELDRAIWLARTGLGREPHPFEATFRAAPRQAFEAVSQWLKRPVTCQGALVK